MYINDTWIDTTELLEYWRMSNAWEVKRGKRMGWTADRYSNAHKTNSIYAWQLRIRAYKVLDILINRI